MPGVVAVVTREDLATMLADKYPVEDYEGPGERPEEQICGREEESTRSPCRRRAAGAEQGALHRRAGRRGRRRRARCRRRTRPPRSQVDYDPLPAVVDPYEARQPGAPRLYDNGEEQRQRPRRRRSMATSMARSAAAPVRVKAKIRAPRCHPMPMETRGVLAAPDPITRGLTIWTSNQGPHGFRNEIASAFGLGQNQVRAIAPEVGGGFGCKFGAYHEDFIAAALALKLNRPVKWIETRSEHFLATNHGRNQWGEFEVGADQRRPHPGAARAGLARFRRLPEGARSGLVHLGDVDRSVRDSEPRLRRRRRLHQHRGERRLPRRGTPGGDLLPGAVDGPHRRRGRSRPGRGAAGQLHPAGQVPLHHALRRALRHRRVREAARPGAGAGRLRSGCGGSRTSCASRAATSASVSPPTSRSAGSVRGKAPPCASSRAAK